MSAESTPDYAEGDRRLRHLHQLELALRWNVSPRTLERWRWLGQGPHFLKLGSRVAYRLADVLAYEENRRRTTQSQAKQSLNGSPRFATGLPG